MNAINHEGVPGPGEQQPHEQHQLHQQQQQQHQQQHEGHQSPATSFPPQTRPHQQHQPPLSTQLPPGKKLRFITNSSLPQKRRRIGAACLTCRKRKTACSGERPFCETCRQNKLDCAGYSAESAQPAPKRRESTATGAAAPRSTANHDMTSTTPMPQPPPFRHRATDDSLHTQRSLATSSTSTSHNQPLSPRTAVTGQKRGRSPDNAYAGDGNQDALFPANRNRMPYFRWLGPTAIMPGFKQMVVKVKRSDTDVGRSSTDGNNILSPVFSKQNINEAKVPSIYPGTPAAVESDVRTPLSLPFYDTNLNMPPSELITHLANTFFTHLGCNYPFLQRKRFLKDLEEKQVDAILVDAVCALAARFSTHALLKQQTGDENKPATPAEYGHAFAQRAKTALTDTFICPSVAAAQAALLLAYNEFGESRDSGLWMYLGISIRIAQDLGIHKLEGLRYAGRDGPTPRMVKMAGHGGSALLKGPRQSQPRVYREDEPQDRESQANLQELKEVEQERCDTFWAIWFLDRMVSSGTGRRCTLRDKDIELSFPSLEEKDPQTGWPAPFPALTRIVHLYGRVADLLNSIKEPSDITAETPKRLASMETQVTSFYQGLPPKLHFDAVNFQHYVKAGEGTNFVLLHFWFHVLIILLHRPTLLKTFEGRMLQLFPNSQQLSMSSAKTIADILSYSQLIDAKASLGNPFTTQPIYIAACAFLKETVEQTASSNAQSRANSPTRKSDSQPSANGTPQSVKKHSISNSSSSNSMPTPTPTDPKTMQRHTLLATAANQHYQLCYKALQSLETYWAGTKYILTVLEQKFEGVGDPLLYTAEEGESAMEQPRPEPAFTSPSWRRKLSWERYLQSAPLSVQSPFLRAKQLAAQTPGSPGGSLDPSKAIGWTLTGGMNSASTHLAWHYASGQDHGREHRHAGSMNPPDFPERGRPRRTGSIASQPGNGSETLAPPLQTYHSASSAVSPSDASLLLGLNSPQPYSGNNGSHHRNASDMMPFNTQPMQSMSDYAPSPGSFNWSFGAGHFPHVNAQNFGDMLIESQDVDMSMLGLDVMPWFDSFPPGHAGNAMMGLFDPAAGSADNHGGGPQHGGGGPPTTG